MKGITEAAKEANGRSQTCMTCAYLSKCNAEVGFVCSDSFKDGFKKGVAWAKKQLKEEQQ